MNARLEADGAVKQGLLFRRRAEVFGGGRGRRGGALQFQRGVRRRRHGSGGLD
jgi:hypothetical protein